MSSQLRSSTSGGSVQGSQLELWNLGRRGGRRPGAGRPKSVLSRVPRRKRPPLAARLPVHVTLKAIDGLPSLRLSNTHREFVHAFESASERFGCRICHYSIQTNHVHLICEASSESALSRAIRALLTRMTRAFNRVHGRRGSIWADRYHARILR